MKRFLGIFSLSVLIWGGALEAVELTLTKFVIIVASYNNAKYYRKNLSSIFNQKYPKTHFRVIYTDDCSIDGTARLVGNYIAQHGFGLKISLICNSVKMGCMANQYYMLQSCAQDEVAVLVDGDDALADDQVLNTLNQAYQNQELLLTYGQYRVHRKDRTRIGDCKPIPESVVQTAAYRTYFRNVPFCASHLKTFRVSLFSKVPLVYFQRDGVFFNTCGDVALMCALLEYASGKFLFIDKVLYEYNENNPINDYKIYDKANDLDYIYSFKK